MGVASIVVTASCSLAITTLSPSHKTERRNDIHAAVQTVQKSLILFKTKLLLFVLFKQKFEIKKECEIQILVRSLGSTRFTGTS